MHTTQWQLRYSRRLLDSVDALTSLEDADYVRQAGDGFQRVPLTIRRSASLPGANVPTLSSRRISRAVFRVTTCSDSIGERPASSAISTLYSMCPNSVSNGPASLPNPIRNPALRLNRDLQVALSHPVEPLLIDEVVARPAHFMTTYHILSMNLTHLGTVEQVLRNAVPEGGAQIIGLLRRPIVTA